MPVPMIVFARLTEEEMSVALPPPAVARASASPSRALWRRITARSFGEFTNSIPIARPAFGGAAIFVTTHYHIFCLSPRDRILYLLKRVCIVTHVDGRTDAQIFVLYRKVGRWEVR